MKHLTTETIENFIKGEYPYGKLLEISAHLLACPQVCQEKLNRIDPDFLAEAERLENARIEAMNRVPHFSAGEIEAYVAKEFNLEKRLEMNRHFTKCPLCSQHLKDRDPGYLSSFIKDNLRRNKESEMVVTGEKNRLFFRILVPAAVFSLLIIVSLTVIFMFPGHRTTDQAQLEEISPAPGTAQTGSNSEENKNVEIIENSNKKTAELPSNINIRPKAQTNGSQPPPPSRTVVSPPTQKRTNQTKSNQSQDIIIKNRSLENNCESNPNLAIAPKDEIIIDTQPTLSWKPLPNALHYKIYLADTANNLVEESELVKAETTSYKLTKQLEVNKKYEWKVVATLKDGKEVYSESAYFSVGEKAKKLLLPKERSNINDIRCLKSGN